MKSKYIYILFALLAAIGMSCEKQELPENNTATPVYFVEGTAGGEELSFFAGENDIIVNPSFEVSAENLPLFTSHFISANGVGGEEELIIKLAGDSETQMNLDLDDYLHIGDYDVMAYPMATFDSQFTLFAGGAEFVILDLESGNDPMYEGSDEVDLLLDFGFYSVFVEPNGSCLPVNYFIGIIDPALPVPVPSISIQDGFFTLNLEDVEGMILSVSINDFGPLITPGEPTPIANLLQPGQTEINSVEISVENFQGNICTASWSLSEMMGCGLPSNLSLIPTTNPISQSSGSVVLEYKLDAATSYVTIGNIDDSFTVNEITPYLDDPLGREAVRLNISSNLVLRNKQAPFDEIELDISQGYIPVVLE